MSSLFGGGALSNDAPGGAAGGDLAGTYPNPTIAASVALTGTPTAPTAAAATNTTQIATTAFVTGAGFAKYATSGTFTAKQIFRAAGAGQNSTEWQDASSVLQASMRSDGWFQANAIVLANGPIAGFRVSTATSGLIDVGWTNGSQLGVFGNTSARPAAYTQTYATTTRTHSNDTATDLVTTAPTQTSPWGFGSSAQASNIATQHNALRVDVDNVKQVLNSVIDDLQAYGFLQ